MVQIQTKARIPHLRYCNCTGDQSICDTEHENIQQWEKCMIKQMIALSKLFDEKGESKIEEEASSHQIYDTF